MNSEYSLESFISSCDDMLIVQEGFGSDALKGFGKGIANAVGFVIGYICASIVVAVVAGSIVIHIAKSNEKKLKPIAGYKEKIEVVETEYIEGIDKIANIYQKNMLPVKKLMSKMQKGPGSVSKDEFYKVYNELKTNDDNLSKLTDDLKKTGKTGNDVTYIKKIIEEIFETAKEISEYYETIYEEWSLGYNRDEDPDGFPVYEIDNFIEKATDHANIPFSAIKIKERYTKKELRQQKKNNN